MIFDASYNEIELESNNEPKRKIVKKRATKTKTEPKPEEELFIIPTYENYSTIFSQKFTSSQLKQICKYYKLPVTGNKSLVTNVIYKHLYLSYYASIIQKSWRKYYYKLFSRLHGPARFNRSICITDTDFFTMDDLNSISFNQFFSYRDSDNMIYGFDIMSLYNLINKSKNEDYSYKKEEQLPLNPYTRNPISNKVKSDLKSIIMISKILMEEIQLNINEVDDEIKSNKNTLSIEERTNNLFHDIDSLGNYSHPEWFKDLLRHQLIVYIKELYDIWTYRAQLADQVKLEICPNGNPFSNIYMNNLPNLPLLEIQDIILSAMETMVRSGVNQNSRYLGSTYVLCALTLVNRDTAEALPWLYESVAIVF